MKRIVIIVTLLMFGCVTTQPKYDIVYCMEKPYPKQFNCVPECGLFTSDMKTINLDCNICAEDLYNLLVYYKQIDKYISDECLSIKFKE